MNQSTISFIGVIGCEWIGFEIDLAIPMPEVEKGKNLVSSMPCQNRRSPESKFSSSTSLYTWIKGRLFRRNSLIINDIATPKDTNPRRENKAAARSLPCTF